MQRLHLSFLAVALTANATAQTTDTISILQREQEMQPVEVRSLRVGSDAPFVKTDLNAKDIAKQNLGQDLPYLLQYTPSAVVTSEAGAGVGYTSLRIRGTDGTRTNVTLNGVPVNDPESQGTFFVNFGDIASSAGSIQLQRGVGSSTNGAGAFGATMSISTLQQMADAGVEISNTYGSFNTWRHTLKAGTGLMKNGLQFDVRLSKISSDGYIERSASDLKSLQLVAGWKASEKTSFRFLLMTGMEKTGQAWNGVPQDSLKTNRKFNELGLKSDGTYYNDQTDNYQQDYYQLFFDHKFSKYLTANIGVFLTRGKGYYQEYRMGEDLSDYGVAPYVSPSGTDTVTSTDLTRQLWLDNHYYGTVFSLLYQKNNTQVTFGGGWNQFANKHYGYVKWADIGIPVDHKWYNLDAQKNDFNLYLKTQQTINDKLIIYADLQYRTVGYFMNGFRKTPALRPAVSYHFFNPKVGLTYLLRNTATERQKVYASIAVANKEPNRNDFEASPTNLPKPESLYDVEAGYEINQMKWSAAANVYYMMYKDQLILTGQINDVGAYTRTNVPNSYRMGVELQAGVKPTTWLSLNANATLSRNKIERYTEYIDDYDDGIQNEVVYDETDIAFSPSILGAIMATLAPFKNSGPRGLELDLMGKHVGRQYLDNTQTYTRSINPYTLCDLRLRYTFITRPFKEVMATLAVNNVLDNQYESNGYTFSYISGGASTTSNYYFPQAGVNWLLGLTMKF